MKKRKIIPAILVIIAALAAAAYFALQAYVQSRIAAALERLPASLGSDGPLVVSSLDYANLDFSLAARSVTIDGLRVAGTLAGDGQRSDFAVRVKSARLAPVSESSIGHAHLAGIAIQARNIGDFTAASLSLDDISIPDPYFFRGAAGDSLADRLLAMPKPLFGKLDLEKPGFAPAAGGGEAVAEYASLTWKSNRPLDFSLSVPAFSLPRADMASLLGFAIPGQGGLPGSLLLAMRGAENAPGASAVSLSLALARLCDLDLSFNVLGLSDFSWLALLSQATFSDVALTYRDAGLMACVARRIMPVAEAAAMALKIAGRNLFRADGGRDSATLSDIEAFIDRPGSLSCRGLAPFTLGSALQAMSFGRLGSLFAIQATPGPRSLRQEMQGLNQPGNSAN